MLSVDDVTPGMVGGDAQLVPHPPAVLPVDALAPRPKQPQMYSRARAQPGKAPELSSRTIEAASIASLSASVQSIEGRVASAARMRATSPLSRILQSQHGRSPASSRRRKLPPMGAKEDEEPVAEPVDGGASAETVDEQAVRLGVLTGSGISIPDMHGLVKQQAGATSKKIYADSALASSWLEEVVVYGLEEIGDPTKGLTQEIQGEEQRLGGTARLGVAREQLRKAGLGGSDVDRLYRALYVYSVGFHEMVQQVVGRGDDDKARAVVNILQTFNFVSEVIQKTSFTNNLVQEMLKLEGATARIAALQDDIAAARADVEEKVQEIEVQEKMYDDSIADLLRHRQEKAGMEKQLNSIQKLMDALSLPGGEIYRLKLLLEEAQTSKHEVVTQARMQIADLEARLKAEIMQHKALQESFRKFREETEAEHHRASEELTKEKKVRDDKIRWLGNEMDKLRESLERAETRIPILEEEVAETKQNAKIQQQALKAVIEDLRKEVKDVKKQAVEDARQAVEDAKTAKGLLQAAIDRGDDLAAKLKACEGQLEETTAIKEKLQEDLAEQSKVLAAVRQTLAETEEALSKEEDTTADLRAKLQHLQETSDARIAELEQEVQDWIAKEKKTKELGEKKLEREKEKNAKVVSAKDEQLTKLRDTVKNMKLQIQELRDQKAQMQKQWDKQVKDFEGKVAKLEKTIEAREGAIAKLKEEKKGLHDDIKGLKKDIEKLKSKHKKEIAKLKEEHATAVTDLEMQINKLKKKIDELTKQKKSLAAALDREVEEGKKARAMVQTNLRSFDKAYKAREAKLMKASTDKIEAQKKQIEDMSANTARIEEYRRNLVAQRETLRQNLVRNAGELKQAREETEVVRDEVEELKMQIKKLETYLRRYRERFQSTDVGCQAGLEVMMEDSVEKITRLIAEVQQGDDGDDDDDDEAKPLQMMELAMQLVEVLEESANLPKGSVSRFFRIAIDEYAVHEDTTRQKVKATNERYSAIQKENNGVRAEADGVRAQLMTAEKEFHSLATENASLKADIERGPPELADIMADLRAAKEETAKFQKLYEDAAAAVVGVASSASASLRDGEVLGAKDYQRLLAQCNASTPITQELLREVEEEVQARSEAAGYELMARADEVIDSGRAAGIDVDVAAKARDAAEDFTNQVTALGAEKDELASRVKEMSEERAEEIEAAAEAAEIASSASSAVRSAGMMSAMGQGAVFVSSNPVGVNAAWHVRDPRAAETWSDVSKLIDQVPDARPMSIESIHTAIIGLYMEKVYAELIQGKDAANMCDFAVRTFEARYGLADLAEQKLLSFVAGLRQHRQATLRIKLFSQFCQLDPTDEAATAINRGAQAQEYFLNVLHSLHGYLGRDKIQEDTGPHETTERVGRSSVEMGMGSTVGSDDFGWATRWLGSENGDMASTVGSAAGGEQRASPTNEPKKAVRVIVPLEIVRKVGESIFATEAASIVPSLLQYIEAARDEEDGGMGETTGSAVSAESSGLGFADLDVVLTGFLRIWEEGMVRRLASMQGLFVTAKGRGVQQVVPTAREQGEVTTMLTAHAWNPGIAALSGAVQVANDALVTGGDETSFEVARNLTKTLQSTNLLLSKTIQLLAREEQGSSAWNAYQLLMEALPKVVAGQAA